MIRRELVVVLAACGTASAPHPVPPPAAAPVTAPAAPAWTWANPQLTSGPLQAVWASDALVIAVGANGTIVRSSDAGATWSAAASGSRERLDTIAGGVRGDVFAGGEHGTLVRSRDRGATWTAVKVPTNENITAVWTSDDGTHVVIAPAYKDSLRSSDGGASWTTVGIDAGCGLVTRFFGDGTRIWAGQGHCVALSTDRGATWQTVLRDQDGEIRAFYRDGGDLVAIATSTSSYSDAFRTNDDGATWSQRRYIEVAVQDAWGDSSGALLVGANGQFVRTVDHGAHYERHAAYEPTSTVHHGVTGARGALIVVSEDGVIRRSVDGGTTWLLANAVTDLFVTALWFGMDGEAFAAGTRSVDGKPFALRSPDGGATWQPGDSYGPVVTQCGQGHDVYKLSGYDVAHSGDDGKTWTTTRASAYTGEPRSLACWPDGRVYVAQGAVVAITADHGATWTDHHENEFGELVGIAGTGAAIVVAGSKGVFRSTDEGDTFRRIDAGKGPWREVVSAGDHIWLRGDDSVARSSDGGATFAIDQLPVTRTDALAIDDHGRALLSGYPTTILRYGPPQPSHLAAGPVAAAASPFAPAVAAHAAREARDREVVAKLTATLEPQIVPVLARIQRGKSPAVAGWLGLDASRAQIAKLASIGERTCGGVVERFCPRENYEATLTPRDDPQQWLGRFANDKLYSLETTFHLANPIEDDAQRRVATRAFEQIVQKALGPANEIRRDPNDIDTLELRHATWLTYGDDLEVGFDLSYATFTVRLRGRSVALEDAIAKKNEAIDAAEEKRREAIELRKLCTCQHITVGDVWPHNNGYNPYHHDVLQPKYRVLSVTPARCEVRMRVEGAYMNKQPVHEEIHKCSEWVDPVPCNNCGR